MVESQELEIGKPYFLLLYVDEELKIPEITTLIYAGMEERQSKNNLCCFYPPHDSPSESLSDGQTGESRGDIHRFPTDMLNSIHDWRSLVEELQNNLNHQAIGKPFN